MVCYFPVYGFHDEESGELCHSAEEKDRGELAFFLDRQQRWPSIGHDTVIAVFRIRIQLNPDPAKNLHSDPNPEDLESGSGLKLFPNTMWKKIKITS